MDHHCPWLSNCIGFYNRKSFILAVFYGWLSVLYGIIVNLPRIIFQKLTDTDYALLVLPLLLLVGMFGLVSVFFQFHLNLIIKNLTTIEYLERKRALFEDQSPNTYD